MLGSSYANALVDLASDKNNLEEVHADMDALASILKVRRTLGSPAGACLRDQMNNRQPTAWDSAPCVASWTKESASATNRTQY